VDGNQFDPRTLALRVGDTVRVLHDDPTLGVPHDFVIDALGVDSGEMQKDDTFTYRFRKAGSFTFVCSYHEDDDMTGTVSVRP
jgi:plastocyanin